MQLELRETTEERDRLLAELKEVTAKLEQQTGTRVCVAILIINKILSPSLSSSLSPPSSSSLLPFLPPSPHSSLSHSPSYTAENQQLSASYSTLEAKEQETAFQLKELEVKVKGVKEYFQEKERELHKRIEVGEVSRLRYEQLESEAQEKATVADLERQRERKELMELREQISDIEKSYSSQIKNTELRAGDAIVSTYV